MSTNYVIYGGGLIGAGYTQIQANSIPKSVGVLPHEHSISEILQPVFVEGQVFLGSWAIADMLTNLLMVVSIFGVFVTIYSGVLETYDRRRKAKRALNLDKTDITGLQDGDTETFKIGDTWVNTITGERRGIVKVDGVIRASTFNVENASPEPSERALDTSSSFDSSSSSSD